MKKHGLMYITGVYAATPGDREVRYAGVKKAKGGARP